MFQPSIGLPGAYNPLMPLLLPIDPRVVPSTKPLSAATQIRLMPDSREKPWSNNPNAPRVPHWVHTLEQENFAGDFIAAILYGM